MKAYRFCDSEMNRMIWLKECFEKEGFNFRGLRQPSVYYANLSDLDRTIMDQEKVSTDLSPDYLGIYSFQMKNRTNDLARNVKIPFDDISKEGVIILFKDRIEKISNRYGVNPSEEDIRFVVLMHEWGHWVTHWPKYRKFNWHRGFHRSVKMTMEALAQLIAYWACGDNAQLQQTLTWMSPQINGSIDESNPYGVYNRLKGKNMADIIHKIGQLRKVWFMHDAKMLEYLEADETDLIKWLSNNNYSLSSVSQYQETELIVIHEDANNLDAEVMRQLFPASDLSVGNRLINRILSNNYNN